MGLFSAIASAFSTRHSNTVTVGRPVSVDAAKQMLSRIILDQPLERLRPTAEALQEMERETPMALTVSMDHYCNAPRLVRFQNSGGRQLDVDTVAQIHSQPGILQDEVRIQHLLGDIDDRRGHLSAQDIGHLGIGPLAQETTAVLSTSFAISEPQQSAGGSDSAVDARRDWLFALYDQLPDMVEASGGHIETLVEVSCAACDIRRETLDRDDEQAMRMLIVRILGEKLDADWRESALDPTATTTAYMKSIDIMRGHGLDIPTAVTLV